MNHLNTRELEENINSIEEGKFIATKSTDKIETFKDDVEFVVYFPDFYEVDLMYYILHFTNIFYSFLVKKKIIKIISKIKMK